MKIYGTQQKVTDSDWGPVHYFTLSQSKSVAIDKFMQRVYKDLNNRENNRVLWNRLRKRKGKSQVRVVQVDLQPHFGYQMEEGNS